MERITALHHINMNGVKRFKVKYKDTWETIDRFFTLSEAESFRDSLDTDIENIVIVYD